MKLNINNLVSWFQNKHPKMVVSMKMCSHHYSHENLGIYHLEGDVFTHTMMVLSSIPIYYKDWPELIIAALLHDIGKPHTREINEEKKRVHFIGHEPLSAFYSIKIIDEIEKDFDIKLDKELIFKAIAVHTESFKIDAIKMNERFDFFNILRPLANADKMGRFSEKGCDDYFPNEIRSPKVEKIYENEVTFLIGLPASGKSTYIKENFENVSVLSRDELIEDIAEDLNLTYLECYNRMSKERHQFVDEEIDTIRQKYVKNKENFVIDMASLSRKSRRRHLANIPDSYNKKAIVLLTDMETLVNRLKKRAKETGKNIPEHVIFNMMKSFYL